MGEFLQFLSYRLGDIGELTIEHLQITAMSISFAEQLRKNMILQKFLI